MNPAIGTGADPAKMPPAPRAPRQIALPLLYAATIFLGAFLLFQVQPIIGKLILPWFGGSASVWTTCLLFFQAMLLLGYLYAHGLVRLLPPRLQSALHLTLLAAGCLFLPIVPDASWKPAGGENPALMILGLLAATIGLPYFVLSTTGPLLQAWFARERPGAVPYRLFALSNLGSMMALLGYPLLVEPYWPARLQSQIWSGGYVAFALLCAVLALRGARKQMAARSTAAGRAPEPAPGIGRSVLWAALAFCPSLLLVALTSHLTQNVAPIPLLWVLPLALYLLSFILCFEHPRWYRHGLFLPLFVAGVAALGWLPTLNFSDISLRTSVILHLAALFALCMVCHGELSRLRPHPQHLTAFYLMIALGGALGGGFVALVAPSLFVAAFELPIGLALTAALAAFVLLRPRGVRLWLLPRLALVLLAAGALTGLGYALVWHQVDALEGAVELGRNFYGTLRVTAAGSGESALRRLMHGRIIHGEQFMHPERHRWPTTYYSQDSGAGLTIQITRTTAPQRVGIVGLGAGTLLTYGRPGDVYRTYEINPLVMELARTRFTYVGSARAKVDIVPGDGRLALEREPPQQFDALLVDAFSGDSVPAHLLTREAFAHYLRHLQPRGMLAVHVSNKFLDLAPVVALAARQLGHRAALVENDSDSAKGIYSAYWVLVPKDAGLLDHPRLQAVAREVVVPAQVRMWTDDYSSLLPILR